MVNALTIDVEDYFHVTAFEKYICEKTWDSYPLRVEDNTLLILDLLDEFSVKATFFILGWVAERRPALIREIHKRGHEIACHGYGHKLVYRIGPENFREDIRKARLILEDICGVKVNGYRAPSYSITGDSLWAFDILIEEGFLYDSSIFPIIHDIYGMPKANRFPHDILRQSGAIKEFPMSTILIDILKRKVTIPVAGGGYLRLFPVWFIRKAINYINEHERQPAVLYFHPWEVDHGQPRIKAGFKSKFRHYLNIRKTAGRVKTLLSAIEFSSMGDVLGIR
jgi:polysaccharide deacetylase family protein (PEP-CTERM system associated)